MESILCNYELRHNLMNPGYGEVFSAIHKGTQNEVAIKMISKTSNYKMDIIKNDLWVRQKFDNPFISQLFEVIDSKDYICLVLEYCSNGNLVKAISERGKFNEEDAATVFTQLLLAVNYLHNSCQVIHRNIRCDNIMFDSHKNIKLSEFGYCQHLEKEAVSITHYGSPAYIAPEVIQGKPYSFASDVWSCGIVLYAMVCGHLPFYDVDLSTFTHKILYMDITFPIHLSIGIKDLLKKMLAKNPAHRIKAADIFKHPFLSDAVNKMRIKLRKATVDTVSICRSLDVLGYDSDQIQYEIENGESSPGTVAYYIQYRTILSYAIMNANLKASSYSTLKVNLLPKLPLANSRRESADVIINSNLYKQKKPKRNSILMNI